MKVGDLVEYSYSFDSESIDQWTTDNKICFVILRDRDDTYVWAKPQFPLNKQGHRYLRLLRKEYPGTRDGFWLLEKDKCRVIDGCLDLDFGPFVLTCLGDGSATMEYVLCHFAVTNIIRNVRT